MSYLLTLSDGNSERLEALARREGVQASDLIERIVIGYIESPPAETLSSEVVPSVLRDVGGIKDLFRWDEQRGIISFTPANKRVFMMTARSWDTVEQDLYAKLRKGASPLFSDMGEAYGRATATDYRSITQDPEDLAPYLEHLGRTAGWGRFSVSGDLSQGSKVVVRVENCVFCRSRNASVYRGDPCQFLMGVCRGIASTVFNAGYYAEETKCCARANEYCEIVIRRSSDSEKVVWPPGPGASALTR